MWPCGATFPLRSLRANCRARLRTGRTGGLKHLELSDRDRVKCATASGDQTLLDNLLDSVGSAMHTTSTITSALCTFWGARSEPTTRFTKAVWHGHGIGKQLGAASLQPRGGG